MEGTRMTPVQANPASVDAPDRPTCGAPALSGGLSVVPNRGGDGLGISVRVEHSRHVFRIEPARDPRAPRFWCLRVYRSGAVLGAGATEAPWWGAGGMTRADLPAAVAAIRADPTAWLSDSARSGLREWMLGSDDPSRA
jgi:hypothetical protein